MLGYGLQFHELFPWNKLVFVLRFRVFYKYKRTVTITSACQFTGSTLVAAIVVRAVAVIILLRRAHEVLEALAEAEQVGALA